MEQVLKRVFVIDDEEYILSFCERALCQKYDVKVFLNPNEAVKKIRELRCEIIIVDINIPGYDFSSVIDKIESLNHSAKFLIMTGYVMDDKPLTGIFSRASGFLVKPFSADYLLDKIDQIANVELIKKDIESGSI